MTRQSEFADGGFFVLRTPLLPHDEFLRWSKGLLAPKSANDGEDLDGALVRDRAVLRDRLRSTMLRPEVREALFVASPSLEESLDRWALRPDDERCQRIERALTRYFARITTRATPFGLFAGCSVGSIRETTELVIEGLETYRRRSSLDVHCLSALIQALTADPSTRLDLKYRPNPTLHEVAGQLRYVERPAGGAPTDALVAVELTDALETTLAGAEDGATATDLATSLVDEEVSLEEATGYISELIQNQILQAELAVPITGPEPLDGIIRDLAGLPAAKRAVELLESMRAQLRQVDDAGLGASPAHYRALHQALQDLPFKPDLPSLFRVDMMKPSPSASLGKALVEEISRVVDVLLRLSGQPEDEELLRFKGAFADRYGSREVSLLEAMDEVVGGFRPEERVSGEALIDGLPFPFLAEERVAWGPRERFLLQKLTEAQDAGAEEISLTSSELEGMPRVESSRLPDAMMVTATLGASSEQALLRGDCQILFLDAGGPSGARLLGRFCHADRVLRDQVERHLRTEEALDAEAIFAEVVHLPHPSVGNVACRPVLRSHEIPCFGRSGAPRERQIPLGDLFLSIVGDELVLRSRDLGRQVRPRMTNPHNYRLAGGVYRFLCLLQMEGKVGSLVWSWSPFDDVPFLPRVRAGRVILSRARWLVDRAEIARLTASVGSDRYREVQRWRSKRRLPRLVALVEEDNELLVDLDNVLSIESFVHLLGGRVSATLIEAFPRLHQACVRGPEGRFTHELLIPLVRRSSPDVARPLRIQTTRQVVGDSDARRSFPPRSEWLYLKLYAAPASAERVLRTTIRSLGEHAVSSGAVDSWFFVRYADPDWHLRVRFHSSAGSIRDDYVTTVSSAAGRCIDQGTVWRVQYDTYEREVERYGGPQGCAIAERLFHVDSEAVVTALSVLEEGGESRDDRWRLALFGADLILNDLGLDMVERRDAVSRWRGSFASEFRMDPSLARAVAKRFRRERRAMEGLLERGGGGGGAFAEAIQVLQLRSQRSRPLVDELRQLHAEGHLLVAVPGLAESFVHMHINRLLRSEHRAQELVLYDFLSRLYRSATERGS